MATGLRIERLWHSGSGAESVAQSVGMEQGDHGSQAWMAGSKSVYSQPWPAGRSRQAMKSRLAPLAFGARVALHSVKLSDPGPDIREQVPRQNFEEGRGTMVWPCHLQLGQPWHAGLGVAGY